MVASVNTFARALCALTVGAVLLTGCAAQPPGVSTATPSPSADTETQAPTPSPTPTKKRPLKEAFTIRGPVFVLFLPTGWKGDTQVVRDGDIWKGQAKSGKTAKLRITVSRDTGKKAQAASSWLKGALDCDSPTTIDDVTIAGKDAVAGECDSADGVTRGYAFISGGRLITLKFTAIEPLDEEEVAWILERLRLVD